MNEISIPYLQRKYKITYQEAKKRIQEMVRKAALTKEGKKEEGIKLNK